MFHNMPKNIVVAGRVVRQFLMATLALDGGKRGGKLSRSGLGRPDFWLYFCSTRVAVILAGGHGLPTHCVTIYHIIYQCITTLTTIPRQ